MKVIANRNLSSVSGLFEDKLAGEVFDIKDEKSVKKLIASGDVSPVEPKDEKPVK